MAKVSTARKLGIAARIAGQQVKRSRSYGAILSAGRATWGHFAKVLHQLWLEITGFVFLAFAGVGAVAFVRQFSAFRSGHGTSGHVLAAAAFTLVFGWFGTTSFWRVHRKK
jgi:hypothetical protein